MLDGLKNALAVKDFWLLLFVAFAGLGIFNGIETWVENIISPRGFTPTDAGTFGALMVIGGIIGAVVLPPFSDKQQKQDPLPADRIPACHPRLDRHHIRHELLVVDPFRFWSGFFLIGTGPILFQYAAEITIPTPEGTSNGIIQLIGQVSVIYVYIMVAMESSNGAFTSSLWLGVGMIIISLILIMQMKDPVFSKI